MPGIGAPRYILHITNGNVMVGIYKAISSGQAVPSKFSDGCSRTVTLTKEGVNEHPRLFVCSTMFVAILPLPAR